MNRANVCTIVLLLASCAACAQKPPGAAVKDADIATIVRSIRADRIERTVHKLVSFGTRNTLSAQDDPNRGIGAARDWLFHEFSALRELSGGRLTVDKQTFIHPVAARMPRPTPLTNVLAVLPGDLPENQQRYLVVSGHYDSICSNPTNATDDAPGANDDASGTAAVLEIARAMAPYRFHCTLIFACVAGEEQGLYGSSYLAEWAKQHGWRIEAMLDNDIIGGTLGGNGVHDDKTVRLFSEGSPASETDAEGRLRQTIGGGEDSPSRQVARYVKETARRYVPAVRVTLIARRDRYLRGGDHIPFNDRGYAAVRFTEPNEDYHHQHQNVRMEDGVQYGDLPEFVDFPYVANVARINAATLMAMALAPEIPGRVQLVTRRLTNDTDLQWLPNSPKDLAGYEVVWRDTTAPEWQHTIAVGNVTEYTVKGVSKDNYLFGVRAVDNHGRRSPVSFPVPGR